MTVPTQVRIDADIKRQAAKIFAQLGIDMSTAMNIFLRQCVMKGGIPFNVEIPQFNKKTLKAIEEAEEIMKDPNAKKYHSMEELKAALDED